MTESSGTRSGARSIGILVILLAIALPFAAAGCGPQSPQAAVQDFFGAIQDQDWNAYLGSILPDDARSMSQEEQTTMKEDFEKTRTTFKDVKYETEYDKEDKDKATVSVVSGSITAKDEATGETQKTTVDELKKTYGKVPTYKTENFKGRWYVNLDLQPTATQTETP
ncbi:MAG: hypothetical protein KKF41_14865 [Actinobacteria bacterium]|nr:hypothetical protein [Actinomycetota bacterium]MBU1944767.1 hypothetical protein [Actinomycetota bacterium]MBU2688858.1 hypothetical protein [Actinomycetota bacterium]